MLLTNFEYVNMKMYTSTYPSIHPIPSIHQIPFAKYNVLTVSKRPVTISVFGTPSTVSYTIKMERCLNKTIHKNNWTPWGVAFATPLSGIKLLQDFRIASLSSVNWKLPLPFPAPFKWKEYSIGPLGSCFRSFPPGINHFQGIEKACHRQSKSPVPFPTPINHKRTNSI